MNTLTLPTVHMNGTPARMLLEGYDTAMEKLQDAMDAMSAIEFNARDYYVQGSDAFEKAREEKFARMAKLQAVYDELQEITLHIYRQAKP